MTREGKPADFLRIAHRGASSECPENTLASFGRAFELGARMIECDLQLTSDGHVVVFHDWSVDRTTNGTGTVREMTLAKLRELDAGSWRDVKFAGQPIPTLEETLELVLPLGELNLELKTRGGPDEARQLVLSTMAAVNQHDALERVIFSSFDPATLEAVREFSPHARIGVLWSYAPFDEAFELARKLAAVAIHPNATAVDIGLIEAAQARGLRIHTWTVNSLEDMISLVRLGVAGVFSDYPGRMLEARARLLTS